MIGNISNGQNFYNLFKYLLKEEQEPDVLINSTLEDDAKGMAKEFRRIADKRPRTQKPVKHISIGFAPQDGELYWYDKKEIAEKIVTKLGYEENQFQVIAHGRNAPHHQKQHDHDHMHIVINMITYDGFRINDGFDKSRLEKILRELEKEYNLTPVISSRERKFRRPKKEQYQEYERKLQDWVEEVQTNPTLKPPQEPEIQTLEAIIQAAAEDKPTLTTYLGRIQHLGYKIRFYTTDKGRKRLKYQLNASDKEVGKIIGGSLDKLKKLGVDYSPMRDNAAIELMKQGLPIPIERDQLITKTSIEKYRYRWLNESQRSVLQKHQKNSVIAEKPALKQVESER